MNDLHLYLTPKLWASVIKKFATLFLKKHIENYHTIFASFINLEECILVP